MEVPRNLADRVTAGCPTNTDPFADMVALWLGLRGLAHQRAVSHPVPRSVDIGRRFVAPLPQRPDPTDPLLDLPGWLPMALLGAGFAVGSVHAIIAAIRAQRGAAKPEEIPVRIL